MALKKYYVYLITNKINTVIYAGVTNNLERRMYEYKNGLAKGFSSRYRINKLVYYEEFDYIEDAINREKQLKNWHRQWKINLINEFNPRWRNISEDWQRP